SSAMTRRIGSPMELTGPARHGDVEPAAEAGIRFDRQAAANRPHSRLDDLRPLTFRRQLQMLAPPRKREPAAIIVDGQQVMAVLDAEADAGLDGAAVPPYVGQRLPDDADDLAADG